MLMQGTEYMDLSPVTKGKMVLLIMCGVCSTHGLSTTWYSYTPFGESHKKALPGRTGQGDGRSTKALIFSQIPA